MRLLTWNLCWKDHHQEARLRAVREEIDRQRPDLVAFQEVSVRTIDTFRLLFAEQGLWPGWPGQAGLAIVSKRPWKERGQLRLPSGQGRQLQWFRTEDGVTVANVHLESTAAQRDRRLEQLAEVFDFLERFPRVVLVGDFNFAPDWPENQRLPCHYLDAWQELHPDDPGYTEDTELNGMRLALSGQPKRVRFDRVLCKGMTPGRIDLVGTVPVAGNPELWPSDHFGLVCEVAPGPLPTAAAPERLLLLGRDHTDYGEWDQQELAGAIACLSVGQDRASPSLAYKGDETKANEDALLLVHQDGRYLLAVADGHFGNQTSHALIEWLSRTSIPQDETQLRRVLVELAEPALPVGGGSTLLVAVVDLPGRVGFALSVGDSSLATVDAGQCRVHTREHKQFFYFNNPPEPHDWQLVHFSLPERGALLLYTDGINECHYRQPETSVGPEHIHRLWKFFGQQPGEFAGQLVQLALTGIEPHPGGQDNIALIVLDCSPGPS
ncbi:MAG: endonuclease/exonuclease/phosphatase family protein [Vulcanimicrobiota bacterium]